MKKLIAIVAICGLSIGLSGQVYQKPAKHIKSVKTGMTQTTYEKTPSTVRPILSSRDVPEKVRSAFERDHYSKDIKPTWKRDGENYLVDFKNNSLGAIVAYDKGGNVLFTERELKKDECPSEISAYYSKNYNMMNMNRDIVVWELKEKSTVKYFAVHKGHTTWFDKNGNHITGNEHMMKHRANERMNEDMNRREGDYK